MPVPARGHVLQVFSKHVHVHQVILSGLMSPRLAAFNVNRDNTNRKSALQPRLALTVLQIRLRCTEEGYAEGEEDALSGPLESKNTKGKKGAFLLKWERD